jgi:predicted site-specific integrase-resolvase
MNVKRGTGYMSTAEAAKRLGISRSTVIRYFDMGILTGEKHPITGWRSVSKESVLALMKKHRITWEE